MHGLSPGYGGQPAPSAVPAVPQRQLTPSEDQSLHGATEAEVSPMMQAFGGELTRANAQYDKLAESRQRLDVVREQLDKLTALGDTVSSEDVVDAAAEMVAHGLGALPMATLLADMPAGGQALQSWLQQQDQQVRQREAALARPLKLAQHQLAVAGLHNLTGHMAEAHNAAQAQAQGPLGASGPPQGGSPPAGSSGGEPSEGASGLAPQEEND